MQQIINWLRGLPQYSEAVSLTGTSSSSAYALTVANGGTGGKALAVKNSAQTITLLDVLEAGVVVRSNDIAGTYFRVRNFADTADLFSVSESGVSLGGATIATLTGVQTLTNKTLTTPNLDGPVMSSFAEYLNQASPPSAPAAGRLRVYEASNSLRYKDSTDTVRQFATLDGTEQLSAKTLSTPTITTPAITGYVDLAQATAPSAPASGIRIYSVTAEGVIKYKTASASKELVDLDSAQTLTNKTISGLTLGTGAVLNAPEVTNYIEFDWASSPGGAASKSRLWAKNDNNLYYTLPGGTIITVLTNLTAPSFSSLSLARPLMLSGG